MKGIYLFPFFCDGKVELRRRRVLEKLFYRAGRFATYGWLTFFLLTTKKPVGRVSSSPA
jgi:hypothetical protein